MQEVPPRSDGGARGPDGFDADLYLASNPDLRAAFDRGLIGSALEHWREAGERETRAGSRPTLLDHPCVPPGTPIAAAAIGLDRDLYLALNPDLASEIGKDDGAATAHWLAFGAIEGRPCFGARAPWDRALAERTSATRLATDGCDLFVEADAQAGEEATIGRRVLAALRAVSYPISLRAYTSRNGRLVLDAGARLAPIHAVTLIVATPSVCRQIMATFGADGLAGRTVLGCFARAPLRRHMPDWLLLSTLDAVLVPEGPEAALLRAVSPVPVREVGIAAARLPPRGEARRSLGLRGTDRVAVEERMSEDNRDGGLYAVVVPGEPASEQRSLHAERFDDVPDPWTGAFRLLAAADRFVPEARGRATRRVDAAAAGLCDARSPPTYTAAGRRLVLLFGQARGAPRGAARLPLPRLPAEAESAAAQAPVLSLLVQAADVCRSMIARLHDQPWGFFELCIVCPDVEVTAEWAGAVDPRVRPIAAEPNHPGLAGALRVATGTHLLPACDRAAAERIVDALPAIARRLSEADRPALLVEAAHAAELVGGTDLDFGPLPLRARIESELTPPVAVSREALDRIGGDALLGGSGDRLYGLTLALLRDRAAVGAVALPDPAPAVAGEEMIAGARMLRHHLVMLSGRDCAVEPGFLPATYRRRPDARCTPFEVLAIGGVIDLAGLVAAVTTEHVLLAAAAIRPPDADALASLVSALTDESVGGACPIVMAPDLTIAEAGLIATRGATAPSCEEAGWPLHASGPGRRVLRARDVHAASLCLATRRSLLIEVAREVAAVPEGEAVAAVALALRRAGLRLVSTPFAVVRLLSDCAGCPRDGGRAEEVEDGWPSGLRQRS